MEIVDCHTQAGIRRRSMAKHFTKSWSLHLKLVISPKTRNFLSYFGTKIAWKVPKLLPKSAVCLNWKNAYRICLHYSEYHRVCEEIDALFSFIFALYRRMHISRKCALALKLARKCWIYHSSTMGRKSYNLTKKKNIPPSKSIVNDAGERISASASPGTRLGTWFSWVGRRSSR